MRSGGQKELQVDFQEKHVGEIRPQDQGDQQRPQLHVYHLQARSAKVLDDQPGGGHRLADAEAKLRSSWLPRWEGEGVLQRGSNRGQGFQGLLRAISGQREGGRCPEAGL